MLLTFCFEFFPVSLFLFVMWLFLLLCCRLSIQLCLFVLLHLYVLLTCGCWVFSKVLFCRDIIFPYCRFSFFGVKFFWLSKIYFMNDKDKLERKHTATTLVYFYFNLTQRHFLIYVLLSASKCQLTTHGWVVEASDAPHKAMGLISYIPHFQILLVFLSFSIV